MSSIKINTTCIYESNNRLESISKSISAAKQIVASTRSRLPSQVLAKNGIGQAFGSIERSLDYITQKVSAVKKVTDNAMTRYRDTDYKCNVKAKELVGVIKEKTSARGTSAAKLPMTVPTGVMSVDKMSKEYANQLSDNLASKINEYAKIIDGDGTSEEKKNAVISWLNSNRKEISTLTEYYGYLQGEKVDLPYPIKDGMDFIKYLDIANKFEVGTVKMINGINNNDLNQITEGAKKNTDGVISTAQVVFDKANHLSLQDKFLSGLTFEYGKNMVSNWIDSISSGDSVPNAYWNIFVNSALDTFHSKVLNETTIEIAYVPAQAVSSLVGYDLKAAYEDLSDKKGTAAVIDCVDQLHDLIKENSTWDNWVSGLNYSAEVSRKAVGDFFDQINIFD